MCQTFDPLKPTNEPNLAAELGTNISFFFLQRILIWRFSSAPLAEPWLSSVRGETHLLFAALSAEWTGATPD